MAACALLAGSGAAAPWCGTVSPRIGAQVVAGPSIQVVYAIPSDGGDQRTPSGPRRSRPTSTKIDGVVARPGPDARAALRRRRRSRAARRRTSSLVRLPAAGDLSCDRHGCSSDRGRPVATPGRIALQRSTSSTTTARSQTSPLCGEGGRLADGGRASRSSTSQPATGVPTAVVAAHELLHAFGALPRRRAARVLPDDTGHPCDSTGDILYPYASAAPLAAARARRRPRRLLRALRQLARRAGLRLAAPRRGAGRLTLTVRGRQGSCGATCRASTGRARARSSGTGARGRARRPVPAQGSGSSAGRGACAGSECVHRPDRSRLRMSVRCSRREVSPDRLPSSARGMVTASRRRSPAGPLCRERRARTHAVAAGSGRRRRAGGSRRWTGVAPAKTGRPAGADDEGAALARSSPAGGRSEACRVSQSASVVWRSARRATPARRAARRPCPSARRARRGRGSSRGSAGARARSRRRRARDTRRGRSLSATRTESSTKRGCRCACSTTNSSSGRFSSS